MTFKAFLKRDAVWISTLAGLGIGASVSIYLLVAGGMSDSSGGTPGPETLEALQEPYTSRWAPAEYRAEADGNGLTVLAFRIDPGSMSVLYALDSVDGVTLSPGEVGLTDADGRSYTVSSNALIGSEAGVTAGLLTTEAYNGSGGSLTLEVNTTYRDGAAPISPGGLKVSFVENVMPGPIDYTTNMKIAPEVMKAGGLTLSKAGGPRMDNIKILIDRNGNQSAIYAFGALGVAAEDFHGRLGGDLPTPADFPLPHAP
jgi:hypothetical protein